MSVGASGRPPVPLLRSLLAWLEIARISNLPTVLSNGIAGATLGACALGVERSFADGLLVWFGGIVAPDVAGATSGSAFSEPGRAMRFLAPLAVPLLAYLGGMILNDAFDAEVDARERPSRPIPSGRIGRRAAFGAGFGLLAAAIATALLAGPTAVVAATSVLCAAIVAYDRFHLASAAGTLILALCRALAALIPMLAFADGELGVLVRRGAVALPIALGAWTLGLSILARSEVAQRAGLEARSSTDVGPPGPCPGCGHLNVAAADRCSECGRRSTAFERGIAATYRRRRLGRLRDLLPIAAVLALPIWFLLAQHALLQRGRDPGDLLADGGAWASVAVAAILVLVVVRARGAMRADPTRTPGSIAALIACLALVDAMALAAGGHWLPALLCAALFVLTRGLQRVVAGS